MQAQHPGTTTNPDAPSSNVHPSTHPLTNTRTHNARFFPPHSPFPITHNKSKAYFPLISHAHPHPAQRPQQPPTSTSPAPQHTSQQPAPTHAPHHRLQQGFHWVRGGPDAEAPLRDAADGAACCGNVHVCMCMGECIGGWDVKGVGRRRQSVYLQHKGSQANQLAHPSSTHPPTHPSGRQVNQPPRHAPIPSGSRSMEGRYRSASSWNACAAPGWLQV